MALTVLISDIFLIFYSIVMERLFGPVLRILSLFSGRLRLQLEGRTIHRDFLIELAARRTNFESCCAFFCSSAGEFEQARPLIQKFQQQKWFVHVFFFSQSGIEFCRRRNESVSMSLAPIDSIFLWGQIFSALRPNVSCVVRHEFWLGFLEAARRWGKPILVNFSLADSATTSLLSKFFFFRYFDRIFTVRMEDQKALSERFGTQLVHLAGDTKYDRVVERREAALGSDFFLTLQKHFHGKKVLICGSIYLQDIELLHEILRNPSCQILLAPHSLENASIQKIEVALRNSQISFDRIKNIQELIGSKNSIQIVDMMGVLAELYGVATCSYVGGAAHHKVHNVLEPMAWGTPIAFGPRYKNSVEAIAAVEQKVAVVIQTPAEAAKWLSEALLSDSRERDAVLSFVHGYVGATNRIMTETLSLEI